MSQQLISLSPDLKRLQDEGYELEVKEAHAIVSSVPYLNNQKQIKFGTLVSNLSLNGNQTTKPNTHVMYFVGEQPCNKDGSAITQIVHSTSNIKLTSSITANRSFSNKPASGYSDYYHKFTQYIAMISAPAISMDSSLTARTYKLLPASNDEDVFNYIDTNSGRAGITAISANLRKQKVGIIGLGGTGSYVLDHVSKTPVEEIHIFDGDKFLQHNAFRAPGAASIEDLQSSQMKVDYLYDKYKKMHKGISPHSVFINEDNLQLFDNLNFVFVCVDEGDVKRLIFSYLSERKIPFVDVGIGLESADGKLTGILRTTLCTPEQSEHIDKHVPFQDDVNDEYSSNIQISELNALNAVFAVIKWKKLFGFYHDHVNEINSTYTINAHMLVGDLDDDAA